MKKDMGAIVYLDKAIANLHSILNGPGTDDSDLDLIRDAVAYLETAANLIRPKKVKLRQCVYFQDGQYGTSGQFYLDETHARQDFGDRFYCMMPADGILEVPG